MKKSWKTTLAGSVGALGVYLASLPPGLEHTIGVALMGLGTFLTGFFARDNTVSSEQAGIK